nr:MAG TPA: hypothetical protein [Caudoviricetes sp.]
MTSTPSAPAIRIATFTVGSLFAYSYFWYIGVVTFAIAASCDCVSPARIRASLSLVFTAPSFLD